MLAALVDIGHHFVEPNQSGQTVSVSVVTEQGADTRITGFNLRAQIVTNSHGPTFESVQFAGNLWNLFPHVETGGPLPTDATTATGEVSFGDGFSARADGTLVKFGIDTKGIPAGSYEFRLVGTAAGDSSFVGSAGGTVEQVIGNGTLQVRSIWQNPDNPNDVNADGDITPLDALLVLNELNKQGTYQVEMPTSEHVPPPYFDVTGDGFVSPADALGPINCLNGYGCDSQPAPIMAQVTPDYEPEQSDTTNAGSAGGGSDDNSGHPLTGSETPTNSPEPCDQFIVDENGIIVPGSDQCEENEAVGTDPAEPTGEDEPQIDDGTDGSEPMSLTEEESQSVTDFFNAITFGPQQRPYEAAVKDLLFQEVEELVDLGLADSALDA